jgi:hypothetical protein
MDFHPLKMRRKLKMEKMLINSKWKGDWKCKKQLSTHFKRKQDYKKKKKKKAKI